MKLITMTAGEVTALGNLLTNVYNGVGNPLELFAFNHSLFGASETNLPAANLTSKSSTNAIQNATEQLLLPASGQNLGGLGIVQGSQNATW